MEMKIRFEGIYERDMDLLFMRKLSADKGFVKSFFLEAEQPKAKGYDKAEFTVEKVSHSVMTEDGESDIEAVLSVGNRKIALLIEDKIDAVAMPDQASRYQLRGQKAVERGDYEEFFVFIIAPRDYLSGNAEAKEYPHRISYEDVRGSLTDEFEKAVINHALSDANNTRLPRDAKVTAFWDQLYDFLNVNYHGIFEVHGHKGLARSGAPGQWITITCNNQFGIQIKSDRGYVDLEIRNYADKFQQFSKDNQQLIDEKKLHIRTAAKALAIRYYVDCIDFTKEFETQETALRTAFDAAKELQDLIKVIKVR